MQWYQQANSVPPPSAHQMYASSSFLGVVIPGQPACYDVQQMDSARWFVNLGNAPEAFVVFLTSALPEGYGLSMYLARADNAASFEFLGALSDSNTSALFQTPAVFLEAGVPVPVVLGISLELLQDIANLSSAQQQTIRTATRMVMAERLLEDLYTFVSSYARCVRPSEGGWQALATATASVSQEEYVVMPASFVNKWRERITARMQKDLSFLQ